MNEVRDLEIFEKLMAYGRRVIRLAGSARLEDKESTLKNTPLHTRSAPLPVRCSVRITTSAADAEYRVQSRHVAAEDMEEVKTPFDHIWDAVNTHLGTSAHSMPDLVEQLGLMRFGHRPRVADTFCGSGQIPFEAARLGCDVYASDLNPVACMLTWGAFNIVGGSEESREKLAQGSEELVRKVQAKIDDLGVETDGDGWRAKVFLYCVEARCPQTGWIVPLIPSSVISTETVEAVIAELVPDAERNAMILPIRSGVNGRRTGSMSSKARLAARESTARPI